MRVCELWRIPLREALMLSPGEVNMALEYIALRDLIESRRGDRDFVERLDELCGKREER